MYVRQLSLLQLLIWAGYRYFKERLPEAICCCLQTCNVDVVLVMYCMYIPAFIVTSADISQLWVYLCYSLIYCLRLFVVVYKLVMFTERGCHCIAYVYKFSWSLQLVIGTFSLFSYILPEAICCCLQTCNVYGTWVTLYCICVQILMVTCANIS